MSKHKNYSNQKRKKSIQDKSEMRNNKFKYNQVENIQREFSSYQNLIQDLQIQLEKCQKYKPYYEKYQSMKQLLEKTLQKLETKENENLIQLNQLNSLKDEREMLLQKQIDLQREKNEYSAYVIKCEQLQDQINDFKSSAIREQFEKEKVFQKELNFKSSNETRLKEELNEVRMKLEETLLQLKKYQDENYQITLKHESSDERLQTQQQKLLECLKELDKQKDLSNKLQIEVQQKRIENAECQEIKRQLSSQANILKRQEILFEELKISKSEDDQRIHLLQDEIDLKEKELVRSKQLNMKLSEEYDNCIQKIVEFEREIAALRNENHELKKSIQILFEKQQNERIYKEELNRVKTDLNNIKNTELDKFNSLFDYIISPSSHKKY